MVDLLTALDPSTRGRTLDTARRRMDAGRVCPSVEIQIQIVSIGGLAEMGTSVVWTSVASDLSGAILHYLCIFNRKIETSGLPERNVNTYLTQQFRDRFKSDLNLKFGGGLGEERHCEFILRIELAAFPKEKIVKKKRPLQSKSEAPLAARDRSRPVYHMSTRNQHTPRNPPFNSNIKVGAAIVWQGPQGW